MSLTLIIILIAVGIILLLIELLVIPGVSVAGIGGFICIIGGIFLSYKFIGMREGNITLLISSIISVIMVIFSLRTKTWRKVGLEKNIDGKVNLVDINLHVGDSGKTISRLAPSGKAMFGDNIHEVHSLQGYIDQDVEIIIKQIKDNKIFIKTI